MATYKIKMCWEFIIDAEDKVKAEISVAKMTDPLFQKIALQPEFTYESFESRLVEPLGAGVDAGL